MHLTPPFESIPSVARAGRAVLTKTVPSSESVQERLRQRVSAATWDAAFRSRPEIAASTSPARFGERRPCRAPFLTISNSRAQAGGSERTLTHMARILITGTSKGLGRATALELARRGHEVIATARKVETLADLAVAKRRAGCAALLLR